MPLSLHPEMTEQVAEIRWVIPGHPGNLAPRAEHPNSPLSELVDSGLLVSVHGMPGAISTVAPSKEDWKQIAGQVRRAVEDTVSPALSLGEPSSADPTQSAIVHQHLLRDVAPYVLERYVRPLAGAHGGTISITGYSQGTVWVYLEGACRGCPAATFTLQQRFERELARRVPGAQVREDRTPSRTG